MNWTSLWDDLRWKRWNGVKILREQDLFFHNGNIMSPFLLQLIREWFCLSISLFDAFHSSSYFQSTFNLSNLTCLINFSKWLHNKCWSPINRHALWFTNRRVTLHCNNRSKIEINDEPNTSQCGIELIHLIIFSTVWTPRHPPFKWQRD